MLLLKGADEAPGQAESQMKIATAHSFIGQNLWNLAIIYLAYWALFCIKKMFCERLTPSLVTTVSLHRMHALPMRQILHRMRSLKCCSSIVIMWLLRLYRVYLRFGMMPNLRSILYPASVLFCLLLQLIRFSFDAYRIIVAVTGRFFVGSHHKWLSSIHC